MYLILLVFALVFCVLAALLWTPPSEPYRLRLLAAGLACYFAALIFGGTAGKTASVNLHRAAATEFGVTESGTLWPDGTLARTK